MAQLLRPDSNVTQTSFTNGFANIDEATPSDADFAYGANNTAAVLEVGLSNPTGTPGAGTTTVRYRVAKVNSGVLNGSGSTVTITAELYQGTTLVSADTERTATGTWTQYSWTPDVSGVSDWTDLRLRFTTTAGGGSPSARRGGAVSWAELEAPDASLGTTHQASAALAGAGTFTASGRRALNASATMAGAGSTGFVGRIIYGARAALSGVGTLVGAGKLAAGASAALSGAGSLVARGGRALFGAVSVSGSGTASASATRETSGSATLAGTGTIQAAGSIAGQTSTARPVIRLSVGVGL
jgi:hypothetical protein